MRVMVFGMSLVNESTLWHSKVKQDQMESMSKANLNASCGSWSWLLQQEPCYIGFQIPKEVDDHPGRSLGSWTPYPRGTGRLAIQGSIYLKSP